MNMELVFMGASVAMTKTFLMQKGLFTATPYPYVSRVTSYHEQCETLQEFYDLLVKHAAQGHCLFGGQLTKPLVRESRAGKTSKSPRQWIVFDFDKVEGKDHAEIVRRYLPPECQNVSYIAQLSASMFKPEVVKWSGHIFMLLKEPMSEQQQRAWIEQINFRNADLERQITLSDSLQALHWPLDRTGAYTSKIVYIAPPVTRGYTPDVKNPIQLVKKKQSHLTVAQFTQVDHIDVRQKINRLRRDVGEGEIEYAVAQFEGHEILLKSGPCMISDIRASGDHYIRFNVNGGDSLAYFIDLRNPEIVKNFKGEPYLKTQEVAEDLYKALRKIAPKAISKPPLEEGTEVLAFYATNRGASIKTGLYQPTTRELRVDDSTERAAKAWLAEYGIVQYTMLPHVDMIFDPTDDTQYVYGATQLNTFRPTVYMMRPKSSAVPSSVEDIPPTIKMLITHLLGNPEPHVVSHFINWLAYIFQTRTKTGTAWVWHGVEGTGKSSFIKYVLAPIFGPEHIRVMQFNMIEGQFNAFLENALFVVFEEADTRSVSNSSALTSKLRHWITDSPIEINQKGVKTYNAPNFSNFIFNSNERTPVVISGTDRRFNMGEYQNQKISLSPNALRTLLSGSELDGFTDVLQRWVVDSNLVTKPVETEARAMVHEATTSINQLLAEAIQRGDLKYILDRMPTDTEALADFHNRFNPLSILKTLIDRYVEEARTTKQSLMTEEDAFLVFRTLIPDTRFFQDSKTWRKRHFKSLGLDFDKRVRDPSDWKRTARGVLINWQPVEFVRKDSATSPTPITVVEQRKKTK
jgi:hypothetical protein